MWMELALRENRALHRLPLCSVALLAESAEVRAMLVVTVTTES